MKSAAATKLIKISHIGNSESELSIAPGQAGPETEEAGPETGEAGPETGEAGPDTGEAERPQGSILPSVRDTLLA